MQTPAIDRALVDFDLRTLLSHCIGRKSAQVASALSERLSRRITKSMLNTMTARDSEKVRFPAAWVAAFCEVVVDDRLARFVMGPRLARLVRLGEALVELGEVDPRAARLVARLSKRSARGKGSRRR